MLNLEEPLVVVFEIRRECYLFTYFVFDAADKKQS